MDAFRFRNPGGGPDGLTHFLTLRVVDALPEHAAPTDEALNRGHGRCELQWQALREIVADVLLSGDGLAYKLGDFVVMPNHAHLLVGMHPGRRADEQCRQWMDESTRLINEARRRDGAFWHPEPINHRVRDWDDFDECRKRIHLDPKRAGLRVGEFYLHTAPED